MQKKWYLPLALPVVAILFAVHHFWPLPDSVAARIDGEDIPVEALDVFVAAARRRQPEASRETILQGLLENRLLSEIEGRQPQAGADTGVGYGRETLVEQQLFRLIRSAYAEQLTQAFKSSTAENGLGFLTEPLQLNNESLAPMLKMKQQLYISMSEEQEKRARQHVLARYRFRFDQPEQYLTLWDLYQRQNMQLKVQMHNLNLGFIREAVKQQLTTEFVLDWFEHSSGLDEMSRETVKRCVRDAVDREAYLQREGMLQDIHDDNPKVRVLAKAITEDEVADYYRTHREEFIHIERVHAYHIRLPSQEIADKVYAEIQAGLAFPEAVTRYSTANDKTDGGALGWIDRNSHADHWSRALAFVQPPNQVSRPFRSPQSGDTVYWEILLVDQRETGYQPVESESVRYRAANAIARQKLQEQFRSQLAALRDAATIRINRRNIQCDSC